MEHKKKKNESRAEEQKRFIVIATLLILVLLFGLGLLTYAFFTADRNDPFNMTSTTLGATNPVVTTLLWQTEIAATEWFNATNTPLP